MSAEKSDRKGSAYSYNCGGKTVNNNLQSIANSAALSVPIAIAQVRNKNLVRPPLNGAVEGFRANVFNIKFFEANCEYV